MRPKPAYPKVRIPQVRSGAGVSGSSAPLTLLQNQRRPPHLCAPAVRQVQSGAHVLLLAAKPNARTRRCVAVWTGAVLSCDGTSMRAQPCTRAVDALLKFLHPQSVSTPRFVGNTPHSPTHPHQRTLLHHPP
eukprot:1304289-Rhodomonas_salina.1